MRSKILPILVLLAVIVFVGVAVFIYKNPNPQVPLLPTASASPSPIPSITPTMSPSPVSNIDCTNSDLSGNATSEGAAGNIYVTLTLTNISDHDCVVTLGNSIKVGYTASNITTTYQTNSQTEEYSLSPNTKVYSQVHYPNGPQCQSEISQQPMTLTYDMGDTKVSFKDSNNNSIFTVSACTSATENTQINIWPLSINSIN